MTELPMPAGVLASDHERQDVAEALREHHVAGRLTLAELDERLAAANAARTRDQLAELMTDLPTEPPDEEYTNTLDLTLLIVLLCVCPPAGLVYWLINR